MRGMFLDCLRLLNLINPVVMNSACLLLIAYIHDGRYKVRNGEGWRRRKVLKGLGLFCEQRAGSLQEAINVPSGHVGDKTMWCGFCSN